MTALSDEERFMVRRALILWSISETTFADSNPGDPMAEAMRDDAEKVMELAKRLNEWAPAEN